MACYFTFAAALAERVFYKRKLRFREDKLFVQVFIVNKVEEGLLIPSPSPLPPLPQLFIQFAIGWDFLSS